MRFGIGVLLLMWLIGGCSLKNSDSQTPYSLSYLEQGVTKTCLPARTIGVNAVMEALELERHEIRYVRNGIVEYHRTQRWVSTPAVMFQELLIRALSDACLEIVPPPITSVLPHTLESTILNFEVRIDHKGAAHALAKVAFGFEGEGAYSWVFTKKEKLNSLNIHEVTSAMNRAMNGVIAELKSALEGL